MIKEVLSHLLKQVILQKTISNERRLAAVVQKVALQINCKLGGELWSTRLPFEHLMIVGVDIYKDKAGGRAGKMIAAVVGSLNTEHTK
jgi:aubergine-like protein